jgi:hypothetical protein
MGRRKAQFQIEDVIVSVTCPRCGNKQPSPGYPESLGWDEKDVARIGQTGEVVCATCRERFPLPSKLFHLLELA